jgi:hypothetical protein
MLFWLHGCGQTLPGRITEVQMTRSLTRFAADSWLAGLRIQSGLQISGSGSICDSNLTFVDRNQDKLIDPTEVGAALSCG